MKNKKLKMLTGCIFAAALTVANVVPAFAQEAGNEELTGTITVWEHGYSFENALKDVIAGFNEKYPNVTVNYEIKDGEQYYSLLSTAIQAGEAPDLFWTNGTATTNMFEYVKNDACLDITDLIDMADLDPSSMELVTIDGKRYSVPWMTVDTRACFYNKDLFAENGWEVPKTFSEFEELLQKQKDAGYIPISLSYTENILFVYEPVLSAMDVEYEKSLADYADNPVAMNSDAAKGAMNKLIEWAEKGYFGDNWTGCIDGNAQTLQFTSGQTCMNIAGSWDASDMAENNPDLNFGAFQIPAEDGTTGMVGTYANGFSIYKNTENLDAALAFAQYCASLEGQTIWVQTLQAIPGIAEIESTSEIANEIADCDNVYKSYHAVASNNSEDSAAGTVFLNNLTKVMTGDITVDEMFDQVQEAMN